MELCLSVLPVMVIDVAGSVATMLVAMLMIREGALYYRSDPEDPLRIYMVWFTVVMFLFAFSRCFGHIIRYVLFMTPYAALWPQISPVSGTVNTVTILGIAAITFFFRNVEAMFQRMRRDREKLEEMSREILRLNETLPDFISSRIKVEMALHLAHEIRNPVMIIGNMTHKLLRECTAGGKIKERLGLILRQAEELEDLVYQLENKLDEKSSSFTAIDVNELGERLVDDYKDLADEKGIALYLDRWPSPLLVQGNIGLLHRAAAHLVQNAIDACAQGNSVEIATLLSNEGIVLSVRDDGPGIPGEVLESLFHDDGSGKGSRPHLGLPYVKRVVEEHLGRLVIRSRNPGTEASIVLPTHLGELKEE